MKKPEAKSVLMVGLLLAELSATRREMIRLRKMLNTMIDVAKTLQQKAD